MSTAVRCRSCGGAIAAVPGAPLPMCLFCGSDARDLIPFEPPEDVDPPEGAIPFAVQAGDAQEAFRTFARSSFWYPSDLRNARLELRRLLLPAWAWSGELETHWTGLVRARTKSGKRPVAGAERLTFQQVLVPASATLRLQELAALGPYEEEALLPWDPDRAEDPYEVSELTRSAARAQAAVEMERRHCRRIEAEHGTVKLRSSSIVLALDGRPVLVPVFIGAYRYGDRVFRVLVNGQSGKLVGDAPKSVWKMIGVALAVLVLLIALMLCLGVCSGGGALVLGR